MNFGLDIAEAEKDLHPIFKTDPLDLWRYVNKKVQLSTSEGLIYTGWVYTIDPVTHNWILFSDSSKESLLVMNSYVTEITECEETTCPSYVKQMMDLYEAKCQVDISSVDLKSRRDAVCRWFNVNRIPIIRDSELLSVANGTLTIHPPYMSENCTSSNEIVLSRIQTLLKVMPDMLDNIHVHTDSI